MKLRPKERSASRSDDNWNSGKSPIQVPAGHQGHPQVRQQLQAGDGHQADLQPEPQGHQDDGQPTAWCW